MYSLCLRLCLIFWKRFTSQINDGSQVRNSKTELIYKSFGIKGSAQLTLV